MQDLEIVLKALEVEMRAKFEAIDARLEVLHTAVLVLNEMLRGVKKP